MPKYEKYMLEIGPSLDERRCRVARKNPDWLVCFLDNSPKLIRKYQNKYGSDPNMVFKLWNVLDPFIGVRIPTLRGDFVIQENIFDKVHAHAVFTSDQFKAGSRSRKELLPESIRKALENMLAVLKPGSNLFVSGEYGQSFKEDEKEALEKALDDIGYKKRRDYRVEKHGMSTLGDSIGKRHMLSYHIQKK